jgi:MSHA biogenesis protein MshM
LWREIEAHIQQPADGKQLLAVLILDEAQNLPPDFFRGFPAFLNFAFDSRALMSVWLVGIRCSHRRWNVPLMPS